jgi:hypothetical protein
LPDGAAISRECDEAAEERQRSRRAVIRHGSRRNLRNAGQGFRAARRAFGAFALPSRVRRMTETEAFLDLEYHYDEGIANTGRIMQISDRNDPSRRRRLRLRFLGGNPPPSRIPQSRKDNGCEPGPNEGLRI